MKKIIATVVLGAAAVMALAGCEDTEPVKPTVEMVELEDGTTVPCIMLPDETETVYEEMSCDFPEDQPTAK